MHSPVQIESEGARISPSMMVTLLFLLQSSPVCAQDTAVLGTKVNAEQRIVYTPMFSLSKNRSTSSSQYEELETGKIPCVFHNLAASTRMGGGGGFVLYWESNPVLYS